MSMRANWIGRCDSLTFEDLTDFDDSSRFIKYRTFVRLVGGAIVRKLDRDFGVPLRRDWHVSFATGLWQGKRAVCLFHSAYHHIWTLEATR